MFTKEQLDQAYAEFTGKLQVAKYAKPRPSEKTFRNNKYSVFNQGRLGSQFGRGGIFISTDKNT